MSDDTQTRASIVANVDKSHGNSPRRLAGVAVDPALRGRGPKPGAPNAGRPPSDVRKAMRLALEDRLGVLADIADNPASNAGDRIRALEVLARYGLGTSDTLTADVTARPGVIALPPEGGE